MLVLTQTIKDLKSEVNNPQVLNVNAFESQLKSHMDQKIFQSFNGLEGRLKVLESNDSLLGVKARLTSPKQAKTRPAYNTPLEPILTASHDPTYSVVSDA